MDEREAEQLSANRSALQGQDIAHVWASPLRRTRQTAALHGYEAPFLQEGMIELDFGPQEGITKDALEHRHPGLWKDHPHLVPLGEPFAGFVQRVTAVNAAIDKLGSATVLLFGHGAWARCLKAVRLGIDPREMNRLHIDNGILLDLS
jgi:broad specificity phosphatase PhoE